MAIYAAPSIVPTTLIGTDHPVNEQATLASTLFIPVTFLGTDFSQKFWDGVTNAVRRQYLNLGIDTDITADEIYNGLQVPTYRPGDKNMWLTHSLGEYRVDVLIAEATIDPRD